MHLKPSVCTISITAVSFAKKNFQNWLAILSKFIGNDEEIEEVLAFSPKNKKRKKKLENLLIKNFNSNIKVQELGEGELKVVRRLSAEMHTIPTIIYYVNFAMFFFKNLSCGGMLQSVHSKKTMKTTKWHQKGCNMKGPYYLHRTIFQKDVARSCRKM